MYRSSQSHEFINIKKLLPRLNQEDLFFKYTGIYPNTNKEYYSIFRKDTKPGCSFVWHSGILYFKDNATYNGKLYFDIIETVAELNQCSTKEATNIIVKQNTINKEYILRDIEYIKTKPEIRFKYKEFDNDYFGISHKDLTNENVYLVTDYWIKTKNDWDYNNIHNPRKTLTIAYHFPHNNNVKLYFPHESKYRFFTNCDENDVYGMYKLDYYLEKNDDFLIITKSQKDRLLLDYTYGYNSIAVQSESSINLPRDVINKINKFKSKVILFDHDKAGQEFASKMSEKLDIPWTNLGVAKDVFESTNQHGVEATSKILKYIEDGN